MATSVKRSNNYGQRQGNTADNPIVRFLGTSGFGGYAAKLKQAHETELDDMTGTPTVKIVSPSISKRGDVNGFDICREYTAYGDDDDENKQIDVDDDDEEEEEDVYGKHIAAVSAAASRGSSCSVVPALQTHVLGRTYHPINDYAQRRDDESSLFWFTYRCDFPEIAPYNISSDAGWGCMLRSAQMLLAQALRVHYKSRSWRPPHLLARRRQDPFVRSVLTWFADFASTTDSVYSLHNMVAAGLKYDKLPGEWYGPGTACYVLRDLVQLHEKQQQALRAAPQYLQQQHQQLPCKNDTKIFRVHVAALGAIYRDAVHDLMTRDSKARLEEEKIQKEKVHPPSHPLDVAWEEELIESVGADGSTVPQAQAEWDSALLLLIPLRLGLKVFNEDYVLPIANTFSLPQSVGVLGGRPRGARWFFGAASDGSKIFGLDPHTVQTAPRRRIARVNGKPSRAVELSEDYMRSVHTTYPEVFSLLKMDPSVALGFYCRNRGDFDSMLDALQAWRREHPDVPELFTVADRAPDYSSNTVSSLVTMNDSMDMTGSALLDGSEGGGHASDDDEDEYVLL